MTEHQGRDVQLQPAHEALAAEGGDQVVAGGAGHGRDEEGELLLPLLRLQAGAHRLGHQGVGEPGCRMLRSIESVESDLSSYRDAQCHQTSHCV